MKTDELGKRIKGYESCYDIRLPKRMPVICRLDGKTFHTMVKKWKCEKPYDADLANAMACTARELCKCMQGAVLAYVQSDEITVVMRNDQSLDSMPYLDNRILKICSVTASMAASVFNDCMKNTFENRAVFDSRVFVVPEHEIINVLLWRQQDAERNSIQMLAQSLYSHKELDRKNSSDLQEMCFRKGWNWNNLPTMFKRGICVYRRYEKVMGRDGEIERQRWHIDRDIPIFAKDRAFVESRCRYSCNMAEGE